MGYQNLGTETFSEQSGAVDRAPRVLRTADIIPFPVNNIGEHEQVFAATTGSTSPFETDADTRVTFDASPKSERDSTGHGLGDWGAHRSGVSYFHGKNLTWTGFLGNDVHTGLNDILQRNNIWKIVLGPSVVMMILGSAIVRPVGTAIRTSLRSWPDVVERGVNKALPMVSERVRRITFGAVSAVTAPLAFAYGYAKGLWQFGADFADGWRGNVL